MDEDTSELKVVLKSSDGKRFTISKAEASCSIALRKMIEANPNSSATESINLPSLSGALLAKIIEWCRAHRHDQMETDPNGNSDATYQQGPGLELSAWDRNFLNSMSELELFQLLHAANYLDVRSLFNASCLTVAKSWEGKKVDEIRRMYQIEGDFTPEEEHQLLLESKRLGMDN